MAPGTPCEGNGRCVSVRGFADGVSTVVSACAPCPCGFCSPSGSMLFDQALLCAECGGHTDCPTDRPICQGGTCIDPCAGDPCGDGMACVANVSDQDPTADPHLCVTDCSAGGARCAANERCMWRGTAYGCVPSCDYLEVGDLCPNGGRCVWTDDGRTETSYMVCATCDDLGCLPGQTCAVTGTQSYPDAVQCAECASHADCPFERPYCDSGGTGGCVDPCAGNSCGDLACVPNLTQATPIGAWTCSTNCTDHLARCPPDKVCVTDEGASWCVPACQTGVSPGSPCTDPAWEVCVQVNGSELGQSTLVNACATCSPPCPWPDLCLWNRPYPFNDAAVCIDPCSPFPYDCGPGLACLPDAQSPPSRYSCTDCTRSGSVCASNKVCLYGDAGGGECRETCGNVGQPCVDPATGQDGVCLEIGGPSGPYATCVPCATQPCNGRYECVARSQWYGDLSQAEAQAECLCLPVADGWYAVGGSACGNGLLATGEQMVGESTDRRPSIALTGDGDVVVGYTLDVAGTTVAQVKGWDRDSALWGSVAGTQLSLGATDGQGNSAEPEVGVAADGAVYVGWAEDENPSLGGLRQIYFAQATAGGWQGVGARVDSAGDGTTMSFHSSNTSHGVSYADYSSSLPAVLISPNGQHMVLWREDDGVSSAHIRAVIYDSYDYWTRAGLARGHVNYASSAGYPSPSQPRVASGGGITWAVWEANGHIYARQWTGTDWVGMSGSDSANGISGSFSAYDPDLAVTKDGMPMIVWRYRDDSYGADAVAITTLAPGPEPIWMGVCGAWPYSTVATNADAPAVTISPAGQPVVAYRALETATTSLRVRTCDGTAWRPIGTSDTDFGVSAVAESVLPPAIAAGTAPGKDGTLNSAVCVAWGQQVAGSYPKTHMRCHETEALLLDESFDGRTTAMMTGWGWRFHMSGSSQLDVRPPPSGRPGDTLYVGSTDVCNPARAWTPEIPRMRDEMGSGTGSYLDPGTADFLVEMDVSFHQAASAYETFVVAKGHAQNTYGTSGSFLLTLTGESLYAGINATALFSPTIAAWYRIALHVHPTAYDVLIYDDTLFQVASAYNQPFVGDAWPYDLPFPDGAPGRILFGAAGNNNCDYNSRGEAYVDNLRVTRLMSPTP